MAAEVEDIENANYRVDMDLGVYQAIFNRLDRENCEAESHDGHPDYFPIAGLMEET